MHDFAPLLLSLAALIIGTKALAEVSQRLGQPAVLGELVAGVLLGPSALGLIDAHDPVLGALSTLGVLVLLFEIGLHTDIRSLRRVGGQATTVAVVGVVVPFVGGYAGAKAMRFSQIEALVAGAALTATSIGISARVLRDIDRLETPEGQIVLGAAVLDDLLGLVILGVVSGLVAGESVGVMSVLRTGGLAVGFVAVALAVGSFAVPPIFRVVERLRTTGALGLVALAFALVLATVAEVSGSAMIVGALAAGLVLHDTPQRTEIERSVTQLGYFLVPIFFAVVGASVDLHALADARALQVGAILTVVGVAGKVVTGYALRGFDGNRLLIGVAMIPRGEVGLIFAQVGLASGAIAAGEFGAIMIMVVATTLITPPWLGALTRVKARAPRGPDRGDGLADLVSGVREPAHRATRPIARGSIRDDDPGGTRRE
ncbi:MAG TPA: cation:proton antiporter [Gemmatimonadaceae bacterium]|nr:cation:proton antiporter [Gemmatimonadaceae bacterium]